MEIINDLLYNSAGLPAPYITTTNKDGTLKPQYIVMHYTGSAESASTIDWFTNPESDVSAHIMIARDGTITQFVPFDLIAWHAGASSWNGLTSLNRYSIGIELVNAGKLERVGNNWVCSVGKEIIPQSQVIMAAHKNETEQSAWQNYPEIQLNKALEAARLLTTKYHLKNIIGHDDIAPDRKTDPGPAFPMERFRRSIFG